MGAGFGLSWLASEHPEAVRATWCVNEGGGDRVVIDERPLYLCSTAEKATSPFVVRVRGTSGHASTPGIADNALLAAAPVLERLGRLETPLELGPEAKAFFEVLVGPVDDPAAALSALRARSPRAAAINEPMLRATVAPTQISASGQRNVIPALVEIVCDCRLLPGQIAGRPRAARPRSAR